MTSQKSLFRLLAAGALAAAPCAHAQSNAPVTDPWSFEVTPYLWAAGLKGDTQIGTLPSTSVDVGFDDILSNLDFAAMGAFEARKGRWGFLFDGMYIKLSTSGTARRTGPGPVGATLTASANLDLEQTTLTAAAAYRILEGPTKLDVLGGVRYTNVNIEADIVATLFGATGIANRNGSRDWFDPIVGVRVNHRIADRWSLTGYADIGGFGAGSEFTWQVIAGVDYAISRSMSVKAGYRILNVDYDKDNVVYDMQTSGIYLGLGIRF
ncbi:MAG: outer membrane beta-barrel protein [Proteobacteria bacterium]|nr:outer membrane beta-barrel protein [Burkholderiales bacterium]